MNKAVEVVSELYLGVAIRPASREVILILSSAGGVDREWRDNGEKRRLGGRVEELTCAPAR